MPWDVLRDNVPGRILGALAAVLVPVLLATGCSPTATLTQPGGPSTPAATSPAGAAEAGSLADVRNVVLVLADDLDWSLWRGVPRLAALQAQGTTLTDYVVSDSLCCPSRTTTLRGQYVHSHRVVSNEARTGGGWPTFRDRGYAADCLPTWLKAAGVTTGLVGKYLNEYPQTRAEARSTPPGWDRFVTPITGAAAYSGFGYTLADNGVLRRYGRAPDDFLNDVLDQKASEFIASAGDRFFLELATFTPHLPSPVAPRNRGSHANETAPRDGTFDVAVRGAPAWLRGLPRLTAADRAHLDRTWVRRAESAESVADSVETVQAALAASGHSDDTLIVVTSDNGFHIGSYRTHRGKRTAFDVDTVVPAVLIGPGIARGRTIDAVTSGTDLGPTITDVLGGSVPTWVEGRSWLPLLESTDTKTVSWRTATVSESLRDPLPGDPDYELIAPGSFVALRSQRWLFVQSLSGERELYDRIHDPFETRNIVRTAPRAVVDALHRQLVAMYRCTGAQCRQADAMPQP